MMYKASWMEAHVVDELLPGLQAYRKCFTFQTLFYQILIFNFNAIVTYVILNSICYIGNTLK